MKKYYCKICGKKVTYNSVKYGNGLCKSCSCKERYKDPKNNPNYKYGKYSGKRYCIEKECNNQVYCKGTRCKKCSSKKHSEKMRGKNNPNFGNPLNMKGKNHPRFKDGKYLKKKICINCGKKIHPDAERCSSCKQLGKLNHNFIDGRSYFPYPLEFNNKLKFKIRKRDNFECQKCGIIEEEHLKLKNKALDVHHINYDKQNCKEDNLITLCNNCNNKVNRNKKYWKNYFQKRIKELIYGNQYECIN